MRKLIIYLKGVILGFIGLAIPGLSASTIALEIGVYNELIDKISTIISKFRTSALFVLFIMLGYFSGGALGAVSVDILYNNFPLAVSLVIIGFLIGGMPNMINDMKPGAKKVSCYITMIIILIALAAFSLFVPQTEQVSLEGLKFYDFIILFAVGMITSSTLIIPGVDFAVLLLALGYYEPLIRVISDLVRFQNVLYDLVVLGTYLIGYGIGSFILSTMIKKLISRFEIHTKFASFAFVLIAPFVIIKKAVIDNSNFVFDWVSLIVGIVLGIAAMVGMYLVMRHFNKKKEEIKE